MGFIPACCDHFEISARWKVRPPTLQSIFTFIAFDEKELLTQTEQSWRCYLYNCMSYTGDITRCVQRRKLLCNCCKICESDWCMLLILAESQSSANSLQLFEVARTVAGCLRPYRVGSNVQIICVWLAGYFFFSVKRQGIVRGRAGLLSLWLIYDVSFSWRNTCQGIGLIQYSFFFLFE